LRQTALSFSLLLACGAPVEDLGDYPTSSGDEVADTGDTGATDETGTGDGTGTSGNDETATTDTETDAGQTDTDTDTGACMDGELGVCTDFYTIEVCDMGMFVPTPCQQWCLDEGCQNAGACMNDACQCQNC
jgi:hypothetical protein